MCASDRASDSCLGKPLSCFHFLLPHCLMGPGSEVSYLTFHLEGKCWIPLFVPYFRIGEDTTRMHKFKFHFRIQKQRDYILHRTSECTVSCLLWVKLSEHLLLAAVARSVFYTPSQSVMVKNQILQVVNRIFRRKLGICVPDSQAVKWSLLALKRSSFFKEGKGSSMGFHCCHYSNEE